MERSDELWEAVVVGTGFGGAIAAARLSACWPGKVAVIERGKRYPMGSFPRSPKEMAHNFFVLPDEKTRRPAHLERQAEQLKRGAEPADRSLGLFDIRSHDGIDIVLSAGLGGGSLIYANVFLEPPEHVFDAWPLNISRQTLRPYYTVAKAILGARPVPSWKNDDSRRIPRTEIFQKKAESAGRSSRMVDICVFFGNNPEKPTQKGLQERNAFGAVQTSCTYCAECDIGCNTHSKNTLDLNYLYVAEKKHRAAVLTETKCHKVVPLNERKEDDPSASGQFGYAVYTEDLLQACGQNSWKRLLARRVILSAGTLGTNELLLRNRDQYKSLTRVSSCLGRGFSGNGDFLSFVVGYNKDTGANQGPVITQATDHNLYENYDPQRAFLMQDASFPALLAWFLEGQKPDFMRSKALLKTATDLGEKIVHRQSLNRASEFFADLLSDDLSSRTTVHLCMGIDQSNGTLALGEDGSLDITWPGDSSRELYEAELAAAQEFEAEFDADFTFSLPTYNWPLRRNVSVHPLGGCALSETRETGVASSEEAAFGQVHGYTNLFISDGSLFPSAVGANPSATIAALAEKIAHGITGKPPTTEL